MARRAVRWQRRVVVVATGRGRSAGRWKARVAARVGESAMRNTRLGGVAVAPAAGGLPGVLPGVLPGAGGVAADVTVVAGMDVTAGVSVRHAAAVWAAVSRQPREEVVGSSG
jgi:hypothetical protein